MHAVVYQPVSKSFFPHRDGQNLPGEEWPDDLRSDGHLLNRLHVGSTEYALYAAPGFETEALRAHERADTSKWPFTTTT